MFLTFIINKLGSCSNKSHVSVNNNNKKINAHHNFAKMTAQSDAQFILLFVTYQRLKRRRKVLRV